MDHTGNPGLQRVVHRVDRGRGARVGILLIMDKIIREVVKTQLANQLAGELLQILKILFFWETL